jgi:hypothetical protein
MSIFDGYVNKIPKLLTTYWADTKLALVYLFIQFSGELYTVSQLLPTCSCGHICLQMECVYKRRFL